jgi:hypothetical protein
MDRNINGKRNCSASLQGCHYINSWRLSMLNSGTTTVFLIGSSTTTCSPRQTPPTCREFPHNTTTLVSPSECSSSALVGSSTVVLYTVALVEQLTDLRSRRTPHQRHSNPLRRPLPRTQYVNVSCFRFYIYTTSIPAYRALCTTGYLTDDGHSWLDSICRARFWRPTRRCERQGTLNKPGQFSTDINEVYVYPT